MASTHRPEPTTPRTPESLAEACREAGFVHLVVPVDGDTLAAAGILTCALEALDTPYHLSPVHTTTDLDDRVPTPNPDATRLVLTPHDPDASVAVQAYETARLLDTHPDPVLALAGCLTPDVLHDPPVDLVDAAGATEQPGVGMPTTDLADGLAHTTLAHTPFSGDPEATRDHLELDSPGSAPDPRRAASVLAVHATGHPHSPPRAATAITRALTPHVLDGPFHTIEGYADVLSALAQTSPGLGVALAHTPDSTGDALNAWRNHATDAHAAVATADTTTHADSLIARLPHGPARTTARLLLAYRSPPETRTVLAATTDTVAIASTSPLDPDALEHARTTTNAHTHHRHTTAYARVPNGRTDDFVTAYHTA